jgi:carbon-monoxide dehydrogenase medium subunit
VKPAPFRYARPETLAEAFEMLAAAAGAGKVLAGGQSLVPILNMRLAAPALLVDINRLGAELGGVTVGERGVRVGALARHRAVETDAAARRAQPLLAQALAQVAHPVIRNRGTTVGSIVHADPAGEMPAVLALLGGEVEVGSTAGRRTIAATELFAGPLETTLRPEEIAVAATFPVLPGRSGTAFVEVARRHGDYAVCGVAALVTLGPDGLVSSARTAYVGVSGTPLVLDLADQLAGTPAGDADLVAAGRRAADDVDPDDDIHASATYRRRLADVLTRRALRQAVGAVGGSVRGAA